MIGVENEKDTIIGSRFDSEATFGGFQIKPTSNKSGWDFFKLFVHAGF